MTTVKKLIHGVGVNDADYKISKYELVDGKKKQTWVCPFYKKWQSMIERCYSKSFHLKWPNYLACYTIPEWHYFMTFRAWMVEQDWAGKHLDKDLLYPGNKLYSPGTCIFVDHKVNCFIVEGKVARGSYPIGVCALKGTKKFMAQCHSVEDNEQKYLGLFDSSQEAHQAWLKFKLEQAKNLAKEQTDPRIAKALIERYENYKEV